MNVMKKILYSILFLGALALTACQEADVIKPHGSTAVPKTVTVTGVTNNYGQSIVYYTLPDDNNLQYVKARYSPRPGETVEVNASFLTDSLILTGFKEAGDYKVELYSVSYGNTESDPVVVNVCPDTPPYQLAIERLDVKEAFGGLKITTENPTAANLVITVSKLNEDGGWDDLTTQYTALEDIKFSVRGQEAVPSTYKVNVKDRWGSATESSEIVITPILEIMCDKAKVGTGLILTGDTQGYHSSCHGVPGAFDGQWQPYGTWNQDGANCYHSAPNTPMPQHFTFDMGMTYIFSRFLFYPRHVFYNGQPKFFEIWGATELNPDEDVELVDPEGNVDPYWTLIGTFESVRPSGLTESAAVTACTNEERECLWNGIEFEFDDDVPPVRYVRFRTLQTWGGVTYVEVNELTFFGTVVDSGENGDDL